MRSYTNAVRYITLQSFTIATQNITSSYIASRHLDRAIYTMRSYTSTLRHLSVLYNPMPMLRNTSRHLTVQDYTTAKHYPNNTSHSITPLHQYSTSPYSVWTFFTGRFATLPPLHFSGHGSAIPALSYTLLYLDRTWQDHALLHIALTKRNYAFPWQDRTYLRIALPTRSCASQYVTNATLHFAPLYQY